MAEINVQKMNEVFKATLPQVKKDLAPKGAKTAQIAGLAGLGDLDDVVDTICEAWPRVKPFVTFALKGFSWFFPAQVAMATALFEALDKGLFAEICKKP